MYVAAGVFDRADERQAEQRDLIEGALGSRGGRDYARGRGKAAYRCDEGGGAKAALIRGPRRVRAGDRIYVRLNLCVREPGETTTVTAAVAFNSTDESGWHTRT